jgi:hypothetical protein
MQTSERIAKLAFRSAYLDKLPKCGCGKPGRYLVLENVYACNKYMRCPEPGEAVSMSEIMADPNHPWHNEVKEILAKIDSGELQLS